jgi:hypothetical protein
MNTLTITVLALLVLAVILIFIGWLTGIFDPYQPAEDERYATDPDDDDDDDDYDDDDYPRDNLTDSKERVFGQEYGPQTFEMTDMLLRLTRPHCYSDNWFEQAYREYSMHAVRHEIEREQFRREVGLIAA